MERAALEDIAARAGAQLAEETHDPLLFGRDDTEGIVSVRADYEGRVTLWRRGREGELAREQRTYTPWVLVADPALVGALKPVRLPFSPGFPSLDGAGAGVVELEGEGFFRYLVFGRSFDLLQRALLDAAGVQRLRDLRDRVYYRPPVEQHVALSGQTYYKGTTWEQLRRLQLDIETTALTPEEGEVFMASVRDSAGFELVLDSSEHGGEAGLISEVVRIVRERDPDVIEGHNLFEFDLPFLIARARRYGVPLAVGRDGDEPAESRDLLKVGARNEPFRRFSVSGREIVDTLHAVKRRDAIVHDIRAYGLKQAARYFGIASEDRELIEGAEIHETWRSDPERVRRYALEDVREVDQLSRLLMSSSFALAKMVPRPYERVATAGTGQGLIEPILVRAYLSAGHSLPRPEPGAARDDYVGGYTRLFRSGLLSHVVKADAASLYPSIMLAYEISPRSDRLSVFPRALRHLTELRLGHKRASRSPGAPAEERLHHDAMQGAMKILINSFYGSMGASFALFADVEAAARVTRIGQEILLRLMRSIQERGLELIEADTDGVYFTVPETWTLEDELRFVEEIGRDLPEGIRVEHDGRYRRMYSYQEKNYILQEYDGTIRMVGAAFKSSRNEPYAERFFTEVVPLLMDGDFAGVRARFEELVLDLRARRVPVEDLTSTVQLTKSEEEYARSGRAEEQYEVLRAMKRGWRPGDRVRYYHALIGRRRVRKLYEPGATDYDAEYYVRKLREGYATRLSKAVAPEDFNSLFGEMRGLFDVSPVEIGPVVTVENTLD